MAVRFQLFVLFVAMNLWCGVTGKGSIDTGLVSDSRHNLYACPVETTERHTCLVSGKCEEFVWNRLNYCHCDPLCVSYDDCCPDYADACGGEGEDLRGARSADTEAAEVEDFMLDNFTKCVQTIDFNPKRFRPRSGHRMVALCPHNWYGDSGIRNLCHKSAGTDGFAAIPVEGTNGRHYKNVYCALCHGLPTDNVTFWSVSYEIEYYGQFRKLNASQFLDIANEAKRNAALLRLFNPPGYTDRKTIISPHLAASSLRSCIILDPTPCSISDPDTQDLCEQYFAPISLSGITYKNLACLSCINSSATILLEGESCSSLNEPWETFIANSAMSMATLLIFSDHTDIDGISEHEFSPSSSCEDNQIYDPFLDFCRDLACPEGFGLSDDARCTNIHKKLETGLMAKVQVALTVTGSFHLGSGAQSSNSNDIWEAVAHKAADDYESSVCKNEDGDIGNIGQPSQGSKTCDDVNLTWTCSIDSAILDSAEACASGIVFTCSVNMSFSSEAPPTDRMISENKMLLSKCFQSVHWNHTIRLDYFTISAPCGMQSNETNGTKNYSYDGFVSTSEVAYVSDSNSGHFIVSQNDSCRKVDCPLLTFSKDDYVMTDALNGSLRLTLYDRVLKKGEFKLKDNGEVEVCNFLQDATSIAAGPGPTDGMWDDAHFILTVTGSSLSLIGVIVTIATYASFPILRRNAAGKSLMCLVTSLFFAQLTMLIGLDRTEVVAVCVTFAMSSHFFWLAAFFWMNILAIDIYRTFGIGTRLSDPSTRSFSYYALYGLGAPTFIVCTCAILSFCDCVEVDVHYGSEHACWIGNWMANLVSFGIPIIGILCSNAVLFSLTVAGVMKTRRASKRMNITQGQGDAAAKKPNTDLILYLKLSAIMGFTWIFGFIASFSGVQFFWYLFIIVNSLQGALVCLAFVCNQRVIGMWKTRVKPSHGLHSDSSTRRTQKSYLTSTKEMSAVENSNKTTQI